MNDSLREHIKNLKAALLSLSATGESGFEGLIGATLREISGVPFRLAGSGSQFGVDGKPTYEEDAICFEGKRYDGKVPRQEVLSKIAELSIHRTEIDIWVLGATSQIPSQLADDARALGHKNGIFILILDWSKTEIPPFAVALAMGDVRVEEFLKVNINDGQKFGKALAALGAIRNHDDFAPHAERIKAQLNEPTVGSALARKANTDWLVGAFSSKRQAKIQFGQPLSPGEQAAGHIQQRPTLHSTLLPLLTGPPDERVVAILGGEGNGKSWLVAQSWLTLTDKPLLVFLCPDDFVEKGAQNDIAALLIGKLIKQTGDELTEGSRRRWQRRVRQWRDCQATDSPRLIVVIDGINQRPETDCARIIECTANQLSQFGGRLVITARTPYFREHVQPRLTVQPAEIVVLEWTEPERDAILTACDIKAADLHRPVAASLRNPRLLGIALALLHTADIISLKELSVSRLLFEHMRTSERDAPVPQPAKEFARRLQNDAQLILNRVKAKQYDDLKIFSGDLSAVADGRFYQPVEGDPTRYALEDDGLTLALGFAVIDRLRTALRNGRNLDAELDPILEPIAALDATPSVVLAALTVTSLEEHHEQHIAKTLVKGFATLQNPDQAEFSAFAGLARKRPQGFMAAACELSLAGKYQANFDWLQEALLVAGRDRCAWEEMANEVKNWLSFYSQSPERGTFSHPRRDPLEKVEQEREENRKKIAETLQGLSVSEKEILSRLQETEGNLNRLSRLAFRLLAGKPLSSFAETFLNWSFSYAFNSDHWGPMGDFRHLLWLNRIDWSDSRRALLAVSSALHGKTVSSAGKWALVNILRATGHPGDYVQAQAVVETLQKDIPRMESWRLIEQHCATDPCDPASDEPENVTPTSEKYQALDVSTLCQSRGQSSEDHFFAKARPAMVRFKPEVAIAKHREFVGQVLTRKGLSIRQGLHELRKHNALLTTKDALVLVRKWRAEKIDAMANGQSDSDVWFFFQCHLLLAFPFLTAQEQAELLLSDQENEHILTDLMYVAKPLSGKAFASLLETVCLENNEPKQFLLLCIANYTSVPLEACVMARIAALFRSESERVRTQALGFIAQNGDEGLLGEVARSDWSAANIDVMDSLEAWYGSAALLEAASRGLLSHRDAVNRISPKQYGRAATMLAPEAVSEIGRRIEVSIKQTNISAILDGLGLEEFEAIVAADVERANRWHALLMGLPQPKLRLVHNFILLLAYALGKKQPSKARELFQRARESEPMMRFTFGKAGVELGAMAVWAGDRDPLLDDLRFARLDQAGTDHALAVEVLAALWNDQQEVLTSYIAKQLLREEPAEVARGVMVAGFSDQSEFNDQVLARYQGSAGLLGSAHKAAIYAYERNGWARHWFGEMCTTKEATEFWIYAVLLKKIVDGRIEVWGAEFMRDGEVLRLFGPSVESEFKHRFDRWESHRKKKLFGGDAPDPVFLQELDCRD